MRPENALITASDRHSLWMDICDAPRSLDHADNDPRWRGMVAAPRYSAERMRLFGLGWFYWTIAESLSKDDKSAPAAVVLNSLKKDRIPRSDYMAGSEIYKMFGSCSDVLVNIPVRVQLFIAKNSIPDSALQRLADTAAHREVSVKEFMSLVMPSNANKFQTSNVMNAMEQMWELC